MLTLEFSAHDLAVTRFACSPLSEVTHSVQVLKEPGEHAVHLPWVREVRPRLAGVGFELLAALVPVPTVYTPDFLTPVPAGFAPDIDQELARLAATDPDRVRTELDRYEGELPPLVAEFRDDPVAGLARLTGEVRAYWDAAIAPYWPRILRLTEGEILRRARQMSTGGPAALFADLHPRVSWERGTLRLAHRWFRGERSLDGERGIVLVPAVFAWPGLYSQTAPPHQPSLTYPPRGVATLWERATPVPGGLAAVLGGGRALLLTELGAPASTTELAQRTGLSAPNVSHHLTALTGAGLLTRHRAGRTVLYVRTAVAEALLAAASEGSS
ncbi:helix-turn-helix domain-containing protein [Kitasatospora sp. McL0602]|uniref:ArsR/SmtB family transcription factor n=1 Tax=Kitasatospora sp. McL0602 TaxID=3439530 RepID=UPI003F8B03D6